ncbi:hypothetical protein SAPIO_CDS2413 [Scedosporium apiospermum]|uniref:lytic cellulose monooxygenase (C4-dehydrogenating) n=1 Tax=Pseudallescheria apiosperma TaxID=563466 RepID=A0A084GCF6_PSEDA|nr:uncharacterized protein SAPIO_CDS2413 [Scedosporium apiospermum]KEZ45018.1 hypothetical protein SAPIO_CDS2413 [Scedosporium apiospermum]
MKISTLCLVAGLSHLAYAHTIFCQLESEGTTYPVGHGIRVPTYDGPQTNVGAATMACNGPPNPTRPSDKIIPVKAGSNVTAIWRHTLESGPADVMDPGHKISGIGYNSGTWGTDIVINNQGKQVIHIPECLEDGQYLLRAEMLALHGARSPSGAQFYMECAQIEVTGGTGTAKPQTYSIPGIYKANDPGVMIDIYNTNLNQKAYTVPGPDAFTC